MLGILENKPEIDLTPVWGRYVELLLKPNPTAKDKTEFTEKRTLLGISEAEAALDIVFLSEAAKLEELIKTESKARAADEAAQKADGIARQKMLDEICILQRKLQNNDFSEAQAYNATRRHWTEEVMPAPMLLCTIRGRRPGLFGLPLDTKRGTSESYGPVLMAKMTELKIQVFEQCESAYRKQ